MDVPATTAGVRTWRLWFALLGGAAAWAGHLLIAYAVAEFGCVAGLGHRGIAGAGGVTVLSGLLIGVSAIMTAAAAAALIVSRRLPGHVPSDSPATDDRATREFVARFGVIANGVFLLVIVVESLPIFFYWGRC